MAKRKLVGAPPPARPGEVKRARPGPKPPAEMASRRGAAPTQSRHLTIAETAAGLADLWAMQPGPVQIWLTRLIEAGRLRSVRILGVPHLPVAEVERLYRGKERPGPKP